MTTPEFAFPSLELDRVCGEVVEQHFGLTIRDYFAAAAMPFIMADTNPAPQQGKSWAEVVAMHSYLVADAMIAERAKVKP